MNFEDKVIYEIYIRSFMDSDGDGIGDIRGITSRLDYLRSLGVDILWITPFFSSPLKDNGYDIRDYYRIDPVFGTMEDFDELVEEAEKRGMGIMLDMVFNHTSTEHEWFQKALKGDKRYMDYYFFRDEPTNWQSKFGGSAWKYVESLHKYYLHLYDETQADLNWRNPEVREELKKIVLFWKNRKVKGFRFDVINLISKPTVFEDDDQGDGRRFYTDGDYVGEYLKELVKDTGIGDYVTVGEMSSTDIGSCIEYSGKDNGELSMVFNFHHLKVDYMDQNKWELKSPDIRELKEVFCQWQLQMQEGNGWNALFWCNHDQPRAISRFGDEGVYWKRSAKMLAVLQYLMRGTPVIYQGEEIGQANAYVREISQYRDVESINHYRILRDNGLSEETVLGILSERSRDNGRTPMMWDDSPHGGFTEGRPWIDYHPRIREANVRDELNDEGSILQFYRKLLKYRRSRKSLIYGRIEFIDEETDTVFIYKRIFEEEETLVIVNFGDEIREIKIDLQQYRPVLHNLEALSYTDGVLKLREYEALVMERI